MKGDGTFCSKVGTYSFCELSRARRMTTPACTGARPRTKWPASGARMPLSKSQVSLSGDTVWHYEREAQLLYYFSLSLGAATPFVLSSLFLFFDQAQKPRGEPTDQPSRVPRSLPKVLRSYRKVKLIEHLATPLRLKHLSLACNLSAGA